MENNIINIRDIQLQFNSTWSDEYDQFTGTCDAFPGLETLSKDKDQALQNCQRLVKLLMDNFPLFEQKENKL